MRDSNCVFCQIASGVAPATIVKDWIDYNVMAIAPLNPVTEDHILVLPKEHLVDAGDDPERTAATMLCASEMARAVYPCNIITSLGEEATQSIFHLHIHVVPRRKDDGLQLPWTKKYGDN